MDNVTMSIALGKLGGIAALAIASIGSALGTGVAGAAAIGAWKKCYAQGKAAPFMLLTFVGAPLSQTIYGIVLMFSMAGALKGDVPAGTGILYLGAGILAGIGMGFSAYLQGRAGAAGSDALAETGEGFTNYLAVLGIIETVAIFVMVFVMLAVK